VLRLTLSESIAALRWSLREAGAHLGCSHEQVRLMMNGASLERFADGILELEKVALATLEAQKDVRKGIEG